MRIKGFDSKFFLSLMPVSRRLMGALAWKMGFGWCSTPGNLKDQYHASCHYFVFLQRFFNFDMCVLGKYWLITDCLWLADWRFSDLDRGGVFFLKAIAGG